jgi:ornithine carbamoyltransferase
MENFLSVADLSPNEMEKLIQKASAMKSGTPMRVLEGKVIAIILEHPSLRTRVSFEVGIRQLGGDCFYLGQSEIGLGVREPVEDIARVLDRWVDGIVARIPSPENLTLLANYTSIPVINGMTDLEHPCQIMGDLLTIYENKGVMNNLRIAYVGDGNNVAGSLALGCSSMGADFIMASPPDYQVPSAIWGKAMQRASITNARIEWVEFPLQAVQDADVVYTDVWISMGQDSERATRLNAFQGYQVNEDLMSKAKSNAIFMHDMPSHPGEEISEAMLDHPQSVVFDQAENRLHAQKAILAELFHPN